jgi:DNA-directed RNA polymerase specialized sigma subunit
LNLVIEALKSTFQELDPIERDQLIKSSVEQLPENQRNAVQMFFKNQKKQNKRNKMKKSA